MATPIPCDWTECPELADILISDIANGDGYGWCGPHYLETIRAMVRVADESAAGAEARAADDDAVARITALGGPQDPTASDASSDEGAAPDDEPGTLADELSGPTDPDDDPDGDEPADEPGATMTAPSRRERAGARA